ncbi:serine hydrolase [Amycolatopsis minnesotensis]|uniref:Serine hydrolase n=1 Tax=Amycolatopsis minnesotensis TaxID=337894 RepID=A0ABN2SZN6_9PSEU
MSRSSLLALLVGALAAATYFVFTSAPMVEGKPLSAGLASSPPGRSLEVPAPDAAKVSADVRGEWSWALRDRDTGTTIGGGTLHNTTESMIKSWLAVDYLASHGSRLSAADEDRLTRMIRFSDDHAAQTLYLDLGGDASVARMITTCGLHDTRIHPNWWSKTTMTAGDATLLGECVARGPGLTPQWRAKLLGLMRSVDPSNAFGIPEAPALAGAHLAIKNGWTEHGGTWAVNCMAIWDHWVLAVLVRYPDQGTEHRYGAGVCKTVAQQLFG